MPQLPRALRVVALAALALGARAGDCEVSEWKDCSACSVTCGASGTRVCARTVLSPASGSGAACPALFGTVPCPALPGCPRQDCLFRYEGCGSCSGTCGEGTQTCQLKVLRAAAGGGKPCPTQATKTTACEHDFPCPAACEVSAWGAWGGCSATCGGGKAARTRHVTRAAVNGGECAAWLTERRACGTVPCEEDCELSAWGAWGACSASCGDGRATRARTLVRDAKAGGAPCQALEDEKVCHIANCAIDCEMAPWGAWGACTRSCGGGRQTRTRGVRQPAIYGGHACGALESSQSCNIQDCAADCHVSPWETCTGCHASCGLSNEVCERRVITPARRGGRPCPALTKTRVCPTKPSCPLDCNVASWGDWSGCSKSCGGGKSTRTRLVLNHAAFGGQDCPATSESKDCNTDSCKGACVVGAWVCGVCSKTCGDGVVKPCRREIKVPPADGHVCPALEKSIACGTIPCPVHCTLSSFSDWTPCTKTCGGGTQARTRSVLSAAKHGGAACAAGSETRACALASCPSDCTVSAWDCFACPQSCGLGITKCVRSVTALAANGGKACPTTQMSRQCSSADCPVDCSITAWGSWSTCSKSCGIGSKTRTRTMTQASFGGKTCEGQSVSQVAACATESCPVDCEVSAWGGCSACSNPQGTLFVPCGAGRKTCGRTITRAAAHGGKACPALKNELSCQHERACAVDCVVEWASCTACTKSCGSGLHRCSRRVTIHPSHGGKACPPELVREMPCNESPCSADCVMQAWGAWGACSKSCGAKGVASRSRGIASQAVHGGKACGVTSQTRACPELSAIVPCPVDCKLSDWHSCSACPSSCGPNRNLCSRTIVTPAAFGGKACPAAAALTNVDRPCNNGPCPNDCKLSPWGAFGPCSVSCGGIGVRTRTRTVVAQPMNGGAACTTHLESFESCKTAPCAVDCIVSSWGAFEPCAGSCGTSVKVRSRTVVAEAQHNGAPCPALQDVQPCNHAQPCPVDCVVGGWRCPPATLLEDNPLRAGLLADLAARGNPATCSKPCGGGIFSISCTRLVKTAAAHGGKACPALEKAAPCNSLPCQIDCVLTAWTPYSQCTKTCGAGERMRSRVVVTAPRHGGKSCPSLQDTVHCNVYSCPVDCEYSAWVTSACSKTCGGGAQTSTRTATRQQRHGGVACAGPYSKMAECGTIACPSDCKMSQWGAWSPCDRSCSPGGWTSRKRDQLAGPTDGGLACPAAVVTKHCNTHACPRDCVVSSWSDWGPCSVTCNDGVQKRFRLVTHEAQVGGAACPALVGSQACTATAKCAMPCKVSSWGAWSVCSKTCGTAAHTRTRSVTAEPIHGGAACPSLFEWKECQGNAPCPVDCAMSVWSDSQCSKSCGGGVTHRKRHVATQPAYGGKACPTQLTEIAPCNTHSCWAKECHMEHVKCILWGGHSFSRVRVLHHRRFMKLQGHFTCRQVHSDGFPRLFQQCKCFCDKHPGCCPMQNYVLRNAALPGNTFKNVADEGACCQHCNNNPKCDAWEYSEWKVCILKTGAPEFVENPNRAVVRTWAGARGAKAAHDVIQTCQAKPAKVWDTKISSTTHTSVALSAVPL